MNSWLLWCFGAIVTRIAETPIYCTALNPSPVSSKHPLLGGRGEQSLTHFLRKILLPSFWMMDSELMRALTIDYLIGYRWV
jgi:hypothetical protein